MSLVLRPVQGLPSPIFLVLQAAITSYLPLAGGLPWEFQRFNPDFFLGGKQKVYCRCPYCYVQCRGCPLRFSRCYSQPLPLSCHWLVAYRRSFSIFNPDFFLSEKYIVDAPSATSSAGVALSGFPGAAANHYLLLTIGWWPTLGVPAFLTQTFSWAGSRKYIVDAPSATSSAGVAFSGFPGATASHYLLLAIGWWPNMGVPAF